MKDKKYPRLKRLFRQYAGGTIDKRPKQIIDKWFDDHTSDDKNSPLNDAGTRDRIYNELNSQIKLKINAGAPVRRLNTARVWYRAASAAAVAISAAAFFYLQDRHNRYNNLNIEQARWQTVTTANNQVKKIILDDGTEIWLNAATTIRVPLFRDEHARLVYLDRGEAYFNVKHNASRPFSVATGKLITRDIGTAFNIRAYEPGKSYRVAVTAGKVDVCRMDDRGKVQLISDGVNPGQVFQYNAASNKAITKHNNTELISAWRAGGPVYMDGLTLNEIGEELARHFNLHVTINQPQLDPSRYTFSLNNQDIAEVLQKLTLHTGISYSLDDHQLTINPADKRMK